MCGSWQGNSPRPPCLSSENHQLGDPLHHMLTLLQPRWPLSCLMNMPSTSLPRDIATWCFCSQDLLPLAPCRTGCLTFKLFPLSPSQKPSWPPYLKSPHCSCHIWHSLQGTYHSLKLPGVLTDLFSVSSTHWSVRSLPVISVFSLYWLEELM